MKQAILLLMAMIFVTPLLAQGEPEMADAMRSDGKIYVVVAVVVIIFTVLFSYLFYLGRRLNKLEESTKK